MADNIGLINRPSVFDGDKAKFDSWMMSCNLYMQYYADEIKTDRQKIILMISYMRDVLRFTVATNVHEGTVVCFRPQMDYYVICYQFPFTDSLGYVTLRS